MIHSGSLRLFRIRGIDVAVHYTWLFIFFLLSLALASSYFPAVLEGLDRNSYWILGISSTLLLFASVLLHELSHSFAALHYRIKVDSITLFFFGGIAQIKEQHITPKKELVISAAGPLMSFLLAFVFFMVATLSSNIYAVTISGYIFKLNLLLGLFNLVPGFPLDGGRIFRAILWKYTGNFEKSTYYASVGGKAFAIFLIIMGIMGFFTGTGGLWYIFLGFFLYTIAKGSYKQAIIKSTLEKFQAKHVLKKGFKSLKPGMRLNEFRLNLFVKFEQDIFPVVEKGKVLGVAGISAIQRAVNEGKGMNNVKSIMVPISKIKPASIDDDCYKILQMMMEQNMDIVLVFSKAKKLIGIVKISALTQLLNFRLMAKEKK